MEEVRYNLKMALLEIGRIINSPKEQLTNLKIESVAENCGVEFNELKSKIREFNKALSSNEGDDVEKVVNKFLDIEEDDSKEKAWEEIKEMYMNAPDELTKNAILSRGLTLDEVEAMISEWKEEKKRDIIE